MGELRIDKLSKSYPVRRGMSVGGALRVFDGLSLTVGDQEFVSIIGPSGCGKSTLLNLVAGLDAGAEGSIRLDGVPVKGPGLDRGVVFQEAALFPWLSVVDNISFGLRSMGVGARERTRRAMEYVNLVGLSKFTKYFPNQLSGGMRQRVGIGRALAIEPAILLMDEPFGALDAQTREDMQSALTEIWQRTHKTVLFITHDIREAVFLSDRILVLGLRPSQITLELKIDLPRPRSRRSPEFQRHEDVLEEAIRSGIDSEREKQRGTP